MNALVCMFAVLLCVALLTLLAASAKRIERFEDLAIAANCTVELLQTLPKTVRIGCRLATNGVPVEVGDTVLAGSAGAAQSGALGAGDKARYYVIDVGPKHIDASEARTVTLASAHSTHYPANSVILCDDALRLDDLYYYSDVRCFARVTDVGDGASLLKVIKYVGDDSSLADECYDNGALKTRALCEQGGYTWDHRCKLDYECPFFGANPASTRGGCNNGYCEFPNGITRLGYTRYDANTAPVCDGCEWMDGNCCENQKSRALYPALRGPEYHYPEMPMSTPYVE